MVVRIPCKHFYLFFDDNDCLRCANCKEEVKEHGFVGKIENKLETCIILTDRKEKNHAV